MLSEERQSGSGQRAKGEVFQRNVVLFVLFLVVLLFSGLYGYNVWRNVRSKARVVRSCNETKGKIHRIFKPHLGRLLFGEKAPRVKADLVGRVEMTCQALTQRLAWWRWNLTGKFQVPTDRARQARLRHALQQAGQRCPAVMSRLLKALPFSEKITAARRKATVKRLCSTLDRALEGSKVAPTPRPIWQWAETLPAVRGRGQGQSRPRRRPAGTRRSRRDKGKSNIPPPPSRRP
jgi:hypothetical protein